MNADLSTAPIYSTAEVAARTGASERRLQMWDEQGIAVPLRNKHSRVYSRQDALLCGLLIELRNRRISLRRSVRVLSRLRGNQILSSLAENQQGELYFLTDGRAESRVCGSAAEVIAAMAEAERRLFVIAIHDVAREVLS
jgi:DNA-binding transcriptional MerR regulator